MEVVHAIEEGESSWSSNFQLLEVLVMGDQSKSGTKATKSSTDLHVESKDPKKVLFCKKYQLDDCHVELKNNVHWGTLGGKSRLLHHVCASCLLKRKKVGQHLEKLGDCPLHNKDWLLQTDPTPSCSFSASVIYWHPVQDAQISSSFTSLPMCVFSEQMEGISHS